MEKEFACRIENIGPERAKQLLYGSMKQGWINRDEEKKRIKMYTDEMLNDKWSFTGESISLSPTFKLLNGHHRLKAIEISGKTLPMVVVYNVPEASFYDIDQGYGRSTKDNLKIAGVEKYEKHSSSLNKYTSSSNSKTFMSETDSRKLNIPKRELCHTYRDNQVIFDLVLANSEKFYRKSKSIMAPADMRGQMLTLILKYGYKKETVFDFFEQLITGSHYSNETIRNFRRIIENNNSVRKHTKLKPESVRIMLYNTFLAYINGKVYSENKLIKSSSLPIQMIHADYSF